MADDFKAVPRRNHIYNGGTGEFTIFSEYEDDFALARGRVEPSDTAYAELQKTIETYRTAERLASEATERGIKNRIVKALFEGEK